MCHNKAFEKTAAYRGLASMRDWSPSDDKASGSHNQYTSCYADKGVHIQMHQDAQTIGETSGRRMASHYTSNEYV